jgi:FixJ family two-component response regulator
MRNEIPEPTVFIVDDDAGVREELAGLVSSVGLRVECFTCPQHFLRRLAFDGPGCLVLDVRMHGLGGLDLQRQLLRGERQIPIVFITAHSDVPMAVRAMKEGAIDFLTKPFRDQELLDAIRQGLNRDASQAARRAELVLIRGKYAQLTVRQRQIVVRVLNGKLNKQIARDLGLSENTIKAHRRHIMKRMGVTRLAQLISMVSRLTES